ncbi:GH36-type glycosyl hydrolase domain-containing protein [Candidatus Omnitrophota bacterium]
MNLKKYGHFSKDGLEFIVTNPETPRPWINYLTNEDYCAIISHNAGGYSFYKDCRSDRILRWSPENWHFDRPGRYIYARDKDSKKSWAASYQPMRKKEFSFYEARHGLGYTITNTTYNGINIKITFFVPEHDTCEVWLVSVTNTTNKKRNLELYPYVEWLTGDYHEELRYRNIMNLYNRVWYDKPHKAIFAKKTACWAGMNIKPFQYRDFLASSLPIAGYATQKDDFLGHSNTEETPDAIINGTFKNFEFTSGEDSIGCLKHNISLSPKASKEFTVVVGQTNKDNNIAQLLNKYRSVKESKKELRKVQVLWQKRILDNINIETPDKEFDRMMNIWVKYQVYICNFWSRSPSYYHEGGGGRGYRDSCQDAESIMSVDTDHAKRKIHRIASLIRRDGTSAPGYSDTTGPAKHRPNKDHPVWLTYTVAAYIKETGDKSILQDYAPYLKDKWIDGWEVDVNFKGDASCDGEGTIFEHLQKNLDYTFNDVGPKGLPLIGHADWNDAIDAAGIKLKGESVWLAMALVRSLKILAELAFLISKKEKSDEFLHKAKTMQDRINDIAWDGNWYKRGFTDGGHVYGCSANKEGKIYINAQSWSILSGVADETRRKKILKSVDRYLDGPHGIALFSPAYSKWDSKLGRISMFAEGTKENAAVFCHAVTFQIVAECMSGRGTKAYEAMKKIMPSAQKDYDLYKTEPYAFAEYLVGPGHPYLYGEGAFTWITGNAGWNYIAATEWLLGARREYSGLRIDPCIPKAWKKLKITRKFRGAKYNVVVKNPKGVEKGVKRVIVDGQEIDGTLIYPHSDGKTHKVEVLMG